MIKWIKKFWRLYVHGECPRCDGTRWRTEGGMGCEWSQCQRCRYRRGYDSYADHAARPTPTEDEIIKTWVDYGYDGMSY